MAIDKNKNLSKLLDKHLFKGKERDSEGRIVTPKWETGLIQFDMLTNGGLPKGHSIALGAVKGAGKTTILIQILGNIVEKYDKYVYYIDVEGGATPELFDSMGYSNLLRTEENPDGKFVLLNMSTIQDIARLLKLIASDEKLANETAAVVIDSDTFVVDEKNLDTDDLGMSNKAVAIDARMWTPAVKAFNHVIKNTPICLIYVHQAREDLSGFFVKTTTTGGNAMKHAVSIEIIGKSRGFIDSELNPVKSREVAAGLILELTTDKNRLTMPNALIQMPLLYGRGVSNRWAYREWLEENTLTDNTTGEIRPYLQVRGGGHFSLLLPSGEYRGQGSVAIASTIDENIEEILSLIESHGGLKLKSAVEDMAE